jgi:hypothetical protein
MGNQAISAHGTLLARAPAATPTTFSTIGELRDLTPSPLTRNAIETTAQDDDYDTFVVGIKRRGEYTFTIGFKPTLGTHDHLTGLTKAWIDGTKDGYRTTFPDGSQWLMSGYVINIGPSAPVDDGLVADVTIRPTGPQYFS